jgi:uracil-DNA glycosylase
LRFAAPRAKAGASGMTQPIPFSSPIGAPIAAAFDWWREAGVDLGFTDAPRTWLAPRQDPDAPQQRPATPLPAAFAEAIAAANAPAAQAVVETVAIGGDPAAFPQDLAAFDAWWLAEPSLDGGHVQGRVSARGPVDAPVMVLLTQPEAGDAAAGRLLSGAWGALLRAMLGAMGVEEEAVRIAAVLPRHMPQPDWAALNAGGLGAVTRHHVALARPARVIAFGGNILPLLGHALPQNPAVLTDVNQKEAGNPGMRPPVGGPAIMAMPDLGVLLERPRAKAVFWQTWLGWQG